MRSPLLNLFFLFGFYFLLIHFVGFLIRRQYPCPHSSITVVKVTFILQAGFTQIPWPPTPIFTSIHTTAEFWAAKKPSMNEVLPDQCLFEIFRRLDAKERSSCACVSKNWLYTLSNMRRGEYYNQNEALNDGVRDVESDGYLTRCLEGKKATDTRLYAIAVGISSRGELGKLSIRGTKFSRGVTNLGLKAIAFGCPYLKSLSLWNIPSVGDNALIELANGCHMLEKLDICECCSISDKGLIPIARNSPNLTSLNVESCSNVGNESLKEIGRFCVKLRFVSLRDCPLLGDHGVGSLFSSACSVLENVKLEALSITDLSLSVIGLYGKKISSLVLCSLQNVSEKGFWVMGNSRGLKMLTRLEIASCQGITDASVEAVGKGCMNMRHLCFRKCCFVSDEGLICLIKSASLLESLRLEACNRITQAGLISVLSNCGSRMKSMSLLKCMGIKDVNLGFPIFVPCKSLRTLSIRNCPRFCNASLPMVGKLCPKLKNVDLSGLRGITDDGLIALLNFCDPGFSKLNLSGCLNLTDVIVSDMARVHGGWLQMLNLDGCGKITDASLLAIAGNCSHLSDLNVSRCAVTDFGIEALSCKEQLSLKVLSLSGCLKLSSRSIPFLSKMGKSLVGLNLLHCSSIEYSEIELLAESLRRCEILF